MNYNFPSGLLRSKAIEGIVTDFLKGPFKKLIAHFGIIEAKGHYQAGETLYDGYDMPYHIHILQGALPTIQFLDYYIEQEKLEKEPLFETALKVFLLGFLLHDANKLYESKGCKYPLKKALEELRLDAELHEHLALHAFFPDLETYWDDITSLALSAESGTAIAAGLESWQLPKGLFTKLQKFIQFADKIASMGGAVYYKKNGTEWQEYESHADYYQSAREVSERIEKLIDELPLEIEINYVSLNPNPYTLLSKQAKRGIYMALEEAGRSVVGVTYDGIVFTGGAFDKEILKKASEYAEATDEVDVVSLCKIDHQSAEMGFVKDKPFSDETFEEVLVEKANSFLIIAPNRKANYASRGFDSLELVLEKLSETGWIDFRIDEQTQKLSIFFTEEESEEAILFRKLVGILKLQWLNGKINKAWELHYREYSLSEDAFELEMELEVIPLQEDQVEATEKMVVNTPAELTAYFKSVTKSPTNMLKTLFALIEAMSLLEEADDPEEAYAKLLKDTCQVLNPAEKASDQLSAVKQLMDRYINYPNRTGPLWDKELMVLQAEKRCLVTNAPANTKYAEINAFGLKARGFSRKAPSFLTTSPKTVVSDMIIAENKLRKKYFPNEKEADTAIYCDLGELGFGLAVQQDTLITIGEAKGVSYENEQFIIDKGAVLDQRHHDYRLLNVGKNVENQFYFIAKNIRIIRALGIRCYISSIMAPYRPHKAIFHYENAPRFARQLGWDKVRLVDIEWVAHEITMIWEMAKVGKKLNSGHILSYAGDRNYLFRLYLDYVSRAERDHNESKFKSVKQRIHRKIQEFIQAKPNYFNDMNTIRELAQIALSIKQENKNTSQESRIIREALTALKEIIKDQDVTDSEEMIDYIAGNLYKVYRQAEFIRGGDAGLREACRSFASKLYHDLYLKRWNGSYPKKPREKGVVAQFAFVYSEKVAQYFNEKKELKEQKA